MLLRCPVGKKIVQKKSTRIYSFIWEAAKIPNADYLNYPIADLKTEKTEIIPTKDSKKSGSGEVAVVFDKNVRSGAKAPTRNGQTEARMKLVFEKINFVHEVRVYFRFFTDWYRSVRCVVNLAKFKECVDEENDIELSVYQGENLVKICGTFRRTYGQKQSDQIYSLYCNVKGDSVMLRKTTPELIGIYEVVVTGKSIDKLFCHFITFNF